METTAHSSFEQSLQLFDRYLRVRWGQHMRQWVIERKAYMPPSEIDFLKRRQARFIRWCNEQPDDADRKKLLVEISEEIASAVDGRRIVLYTKSLDRRVFDMLVQADIQGFGGYSRYADEMERLQRIEDERKERVLNEEISDLNREMYDQIDFIERKRATDLLNGKSWQEMITSGVKPSGNPASGRVRVVDKRTVQPAETDLVTV